MNNLYKSLGSQTMKLPGTLGNIQTFMNQFNQFRQTFNGNPQQQIQEMLNSGKISQEDYNQAVKMAQTIQGMMGIK